MIETRWSTAADAGSLARVHQNAWRFAYAGIIPGVALERRIAARGPKWWQRIHRLGGRALVIEFDGRLTGYAMLGRCRSGDFGAAGEIYELYLEPTYHGAGLGRRLFGEARRLLRARSLRGLMVWSLADNDCGCRFYRALGGKDTARSVVRMCGVPLDQIAFGWA